MSYKILAKPRIDEPLNIVRRKENLINHVRIENVVNEKPITYRRKKCPKMPLDEMLPVACASVNYDTGQCFSA